MPLTAASTVHRHRNLRLVVLGDQNAKVDSNNFTFPTTTSKEEPPGEVRPLQVARVGVKLEVLRGEAEGGETEHGRLEDSGWARGEQVLAALLLQGEKPK